MKRIVLLTALWALAFSPVSALTPMRTVVNTQQVPLVYIFIPQEELPVNLANNDSPPGIDETHLLLNEHKNELEVLPPGGMWKIPDGRGLLTGFYLPTGETEVATEISYVSIVLNPGRNPVYAGPATTSVMGSGERYQLPEYGEPVLLDGLDGDWQKLRDRSVDVLLSTTTRPKRVEQSLSGTLIPVELARHWQHDGTGVRRIRYIPGRQSHFLSITSTEEIARGTYYYFRLYSDRKRDAFYGSVIVPVLDGAGPILFRPSGRDSLIPVGQYIYSGSFLEVSISGTYAEVLFPPGISESWTADFAVAAGSGADREVFTLTTLHLGGAVTGR